MKVTKYQKVSPKVHRPYRLILLTDIHNKPFDRLVQQVAGEKPDAILVAGDIVDRHRKTWKRALPFLRACADVITETDYKMQKIFQALQMVGDRVDESPEMLVRDEGD